MTKFVYAFSEGSKDQKDLLGGKGANLAEMTNLGLPVPPGFTISTEACREFLGTGGRGEDGRGEDGRAEDGRGEGERLPAGLSDEIAEHLGQLEKAMGKR